MNLDIKSVLGKAYKKTEIGILKHSLESHLQSYTGDHNAMWAEPEFTGKYIDICTKYYKNTGNIEVPGTYRQNSLCLIVLFTLSAIWRSSRGRSGAQRRR